MKQKDRDGKPFQQDRSSRTVPMAIMFIVLCGFSFYLGGIFCSEKDRYVTKNVEDIVESSPKATATLSPLQTKDVTFTDCGIEYQDYTPCTDPKVVIFLVSIRFYFIFHSHIN